MTERPSTSATLERVATRRPIPPRVAPPRWPQRLSLLLALLGVVSLATGGVVWARDASGVVADNASVLAHDMFRVQYSDAPSVVLLNYTHGEQVEYTVELTNEGPLPITVEGVAADDFEAERRLLRITGVRPTDTSDTDATLQPFTLGRGESRAVVVTAEYDNCEYYTERAIDLIRHLPVTWSVLGTSHTTQVALPEELGVRSPYIRRCPERVMDRGARSRTGNG